MFSSPGGPGGRQFVAALGRRLPPWPVLTTYAAAAAVVLAGSVFDRSTCVWRALTGLPCPGCGMIHACLALAHGQFREAWAFNPVSFVAVPVLTRAGFRTLKERR